MDYSTYPKMINELYDDPDSLKAKIHHALEIKNAILENLYNEYRQVVPFIDTDTVMYPYIAKSVEFLRNSKIENLYKAL